MAEARSALVLILTATLGWPVPTTAQAPTAPPVSSARVTVLSTNVADSFREHTLIGEWGFSALVESNGRRLLFDTGAAPETVLARPRSCRACGSPVPFPGLTQSTITARTYS